MLIKKNLPVGRGLGGVGRQLGGVRDSGGVQVNSQEER